MGSHAECTRIHGLEGYRVKEVVFDGTEDRPRLPIRIERRWVRGHPCSGCGRRTWQVRDAADRTWDDLPWARYLVTLVYRQRRVCCRTCGIRTQRIGFADSKAGVTRRLHQPIWLGCQSMPTSRAALRRGVRWGNAGRAERAFLEAWDATRPTRRPRQLGADEIQRGKGYRFWTVLSDAVRGEVWHLARDRTERNLTGCSRSASMPGSALPSRLSVPTCIGPI